MPGLARIRVQSLSNSEQTKSMSTQLTAIARIHSPFKQKFAVPRQPGLVEEAVGRIEFLPGYDDPNCLREIEQFSHLWLLFEFHEVADKGWSATVQPPRLGGKERVGVFASRSPFRPNNIGLSVVKNLGHELIGGKPVLHVGGIDLTDQTPILDIKPYVPWVDAIPEAEAGFAQQAPANNFPIDFADSATEQLKKYADQYPNLETLIRAILNQDPRPAWRVKEGDDKQYGMALYDLNIKWQWRDGRIVVLAISPL